MPHALLPRQHERIPAFIAHLESAGVIEEKKIVRLEGRTFTLESHETKDSTLLRFMPLPERDHLDRLYASLDVLPWGIVAVSLEQDDPSIVFCNGRAGVLLDVNYMRMKGMPVSQVFRVGGIDIDLKRHLYESTQTHEDVEMQIDGKSGWARLYFIPYVRSRRYCLIVLEDMTDKKIMEGQYFQAQRLESLGQLAGGVAHDFNNILSIIDGYARMAKKNIPPDVAALTPIENIMKAVQRGSALTSRLLTFGRHKVIKEKTFDMGQVIEDQEPLLRPLMDASISMVLRVENGLMVEGSPDHLCQILFNLCINARDAMPEGGDLIIECLGEKSKRDEEKAVLKVIDSGAGMSTEIKSRIFDPFFTTKEQGKGTGLGLSMVYGLVRDMAGEIDVESHPGKGSIFTVSFPIAGTRAQARAAMDMTVSLRDLKGMTAMVVEDEPDLLGIISGMLEDMGISVLKASNGNEALLLQDSFEGDIDFLLTDVVMPEVNGVKLAEMFRSCRPSSKIMFMSGYPAHGQMARVEVPDDAFLMSKPIDYETLSSMICTMLRGGNDNLREEWGRRTGQWRSA